MFSPDFCVTLGFIFLRTYDRCLLGDELWLWDGEKWRKVHPWQMFGSLILSHMGLNTFWTQWDSTNEQRFSLTYLSGATDSVLFPYFVLVRWLLVVPSHYHLRLNVHRWVLPASVLDRRNLLESMDSFCSGLFILFRLHSEAVLTSWCSQKAARSLGCRSSIDVWLLVLARSPQSSSSWET